MAVVSKFDTDFTCKDVHTWTGSCVGATLDLAAHSLKGGSVIFFGPIYLIQLILKSRKINREYLKQHFLAYTQSCVFGTLMGCTFMAVHCFLRKILRKYYLITMAFIPGFFSGLTILMEHHSRRGIVIATYINMTLEYLIRHLEARGMIKRARKKDTLMFMILSGALMYLLRKYHQHSSRAAQLWFFVPLPPRQKDGARKKVRIKTLQNDANHNTSCYIGSAAPRICPHSGTCFKNTVKASGKLFIIGFGLQIIRYLTPHTHKPQNSWTISSAVFNWNNFLLSGFLGGYVAIFQMVSCLLNQYRGHDSETHSILAGFLAGSTYYLHPNIAIALSTLTTILQVLAMEISRRRIIPHPKTLEAIIFALCNATLFHGKMMEPKLCPRLISTLMTIGSDGKVDLMQKEAQKIIPSVLH